jgi:hypothetical protein
LSLGDFARNTTHRNTRREYYFYPENPQILDILILTINTQEYTKRILFSSRKSSNPENPDSDQKYHV